MADAHEGTPVARPLDEDRLAHADQVLAEALPNLVQWRVSTDGEFNTVAVFPSTGAFTVKIPENRTGYDTDAALDREVDVLDLVAQGVDDTATKLPVKIPRIIATSGDSAYHWAAFTAAGGKVFKRGEVRDRFTTREYQDLGRRLGGLTVGIAQAVNVDTFRQEMAPWDKDVIDREAQFKLILGELSMFEGLGYRNLTRLLTKLGGEYHDLQVEREAATPIVIHDDLHQGNWAFSKNENDEWELVEVFDWAVAKVGTAARNFRHLAMYPEALQTALATWQEETNEAIPERLVNFWTNMHYAVSCIQCIRNFGTVSEYMTQTMPLLYPDIDWQTEFAAATPIRGRFTKDK